MRSDPNVRSGEAAVALSRLDPREMDLTVQFSGNERNYTFCNRAGASFDDVSLVSGLDHPGDSRSVAVTDFDRDGWPDLVLANANTPQILFLRNRLGDASRGRGAAAMPAVAVRLVGGGPGSNGERWTNPEGIGAQLRFDLGGRTLLREKRAGEGLAAQNSATLLVGIGDAPRVETLEVRWPSGRLSKIGPVEPGALVTVFEDPAENGGLPARIEPYRPGGAVAAARLAAPAEPRGRRPTLASPIRPAADALVLYTSMATWCAVCKGELPQIARLRESFAADELELVAVPVDPADDDAKLATYVAAHRPAYRLHPELGRDGTFRRDFTALVTLATGLDGLPSSVVTRADGTVLHVAPGVPSVSDLRRLRRQVDAPR